jgi:hypothetical protein
MQITPLAWPIVLLMTASALGCGATIGIAVIGGGSVGSAVMEIDTVEGETIEVDLKVTGGMMDMGASRLNGEAEFDLEFVDEPTGTDLLGGYEGFVASGAMLLGGAYHALENEQHISLDIGGLMMTFGLSMITGHEWLHLDVDGDDDGIDDEAADITDGEPGAGA